MRGPNMSYCAFENTNMALDQLSYMVSEAIEENEPLDFSSNQEAYAFRTIRSRLQDLLEFLQEYDEMFPVKEKESDDV